MRCELVKRRNCKAAKRQTGVQLALRFCPSPLLRFLKPRPRFSNEKGYTLAVVAVFTTVLLVTLSGAVLNWQKAVQREREEELIFRGKQFMRAIELWQRKFPGTYPTTIDALLSTSNTRFLRKKWKDPITNSDDWRLIKMNPDGSISGLTIIPGASPLGPSAFGSPTGGSGAASGTRAQAGAAAGASSRAGISPSPRSCSNRATGEARAIGVQSRSRRDRRSCKQKRERILEGLQRQKQVQRMGVLLGSAGSTCQRIPRPAVPSSAPLRRNASALTPAESATVTTQLRCSLEPIRSSHLE